MKKIVQMDRKGDIDTRLFRLVEAFVCFLLLVFCLIVSVLSGKVTESRVYKIENTDREDEQETSEKDEWKGENAGYILEGDKLREGRISDTAEGIWEKTAVDNVKNIQEIWLKGNQNPYFFPNGTTNVMYEYCTGGNAEENGSVKSGQIEMSVCVERTFRDGILYSLKPAGGEEAFEDGADGRKEGLNPGYFFVQSEKIYLIRDVDIDSVSSAEELMSAGTVVCQPESQKEDFDKNMTYGRHEFIKAADGKCAFYSYSDEAPYSYEYFVWQEQKGLTEYRKGYGTEEESALRMTGAEQSSFVDEKAFNPYFFPDGTTVAEYEGEFWLDGLDWTDSGIHVELEISRERVLENGILYQMKIMDNEELRSCDSLLREEDKARMNLGYFYVRADKIYRIGDMEIRPGISEGELMDAGRIVCQPEPRGVSEERDEDWCYDSIHIIGDRCYYYRGQGGEGTSYWECFVWQKGFGLVEYRSGWGAGRDMIYIMEK